MPTFPIEIKPTSNAAIVKFETTRFLTRHESFEFSNIEEATDSPLAQQLFHLPFVKTVFIAQNFIAIEKYNIVSWPEVQAEVADQISVYLEKDGMVIKEKEADSDKKLAVTVYAESTPNPGVMKFVTNKKLVVQAAEFKNIDEAAHAPLAQALFHFPFVKEVFVDENYVSVHKYNMAEWNDISNELREFIRDYLQEGKPVLNDEIISSSQQTTTDQQQKPPENLDETSRSIVDILDEYIKPAVTSDGGNIIFDSYDPHQKKVKVILQGACSGCPSSTVTLKNGIETMLKDMLRGKVETVEAVS